MVTFPPCKINLGLNILRKRPDGYHDIDTCFLSVPWTDVLEIVIANELQFTNSGVHIPGTQADNLCLKAYHLLKRDFDIGPVRIHLHKIIPMGAGLGGGSADAAYALRLLNDIFNLNLSTEDLKSYASQLGSDCAFFLYDQPMLGRGKGDVLSPLELPLDDKFLLIVKPDEHVSTAEAYADIKPDQPGIELKTVLETMPVSTWKDKLKNDFEDCVFQKYPRIKELKLNLYAMGAVYASMSGSGSAVFGIFENQIDAKKVFSQYTTWVGRL